MVASLLWGYVEENIAIMKDRLISDMLQKHYHYGKQFSEWVDLAHDISLFCQIFLILSVDHLIKVLYNLF